MRAWSKSPRGRTTRNENLARAADREPSCSGNGRLVTGDAAHSTPPTRAQGANQALEDAWALAAALRDAATAYYTRWLRRISTYLDPASFRRLSPRKAG